jgi:son of sevenless
LYLYAFLLTYRNFTTPVDLLKKLNERYNIPPPSLSLEEFQIFKLEFLLPIRLRICQVLKIWIVNHASDFRKNDEAMKLLNNFVKEMEKTKIGIGATQISNSIKKYILKRDTFEIQQMNTISKEIKQLEEYTTPSSSPNSKSLSVNSPSGSSPKPKLPKLLSKMNTMKPMEYQIKINQLDITEWDPVEIARQLVLIEFSMFEKIRAKECLNQAWNKGL